MLLSEISKLNLWCSLEELIKAFHFFIQHMICMFLSSPIPVVLTNGFGTKKTLHWCHLLVLYFVHISLQHVYIFPMTITMSWNLQFELIHDTSQQRRWWILPDAVHTVKCSWWWAKTSPKNVGLTGNNKLTYVVAFFGYLNNSITVHELMKVKPAHSLYA